MILLVRTLSDCGGEEQDCGLKASFPQRPFVGSLRSSELQRACVYVRAGVWPATTDGSQAGPPSQDAQVIACVGR